ncbi:hypothetical protein RJ639_044934 [Escallonia herrerae]|uniref:Iron-sulfur cluster biosynthesis family protein n=1 Tax=Escallonia herrerae TaxID=1293975 RepID=A0AA88WG07_9ASTE|nr:hypothetical protein RJ639_044934 [Escallonia herrerae]
MACITPCFTITAKLSSKPLLLIKPLHFHNHHSLRSNQASLTLHTSSKFRRNRPGAALPLIRASIDVTATSFRPGGVVESDRLPSDVRRRAMDAIDACGGRVTVGDVASRAGLKLDQAQKALQALAADTDGFLEVSDEGDVLYVFPKGYQSKLAAKSFRIKIEPLIEKAKSGAEYLVRVSFGTALIASIVLVYTTIIAILSSKSDEDNRGRRGGRSFDTGFSFYLNPSDLFCMVAAWMERTDISYRKRVLDLDVLGEEREVTPNLLTEGDHLQQSSLTELWLLPYLDPELRYWDPYYYRRRRVRADDDGNNFIESVFSFVFGDGDPNQGAEEERWKLLGQYIASNGGVTTAEELAPYLDVGTTENDESYILPVLLRFEGQPEVDEEVLFGHRNSETFSVRGFVLDEEESGKGVGDCSDKFGNILYHFPSLQRTASSQKGGRKEYVGRRWADWVGSVEKFFREKKWQFSKTSSSERAMVIGLGGLNLFGVIILGTMLKYGSYLLCFSILNVLNMTATPSGFITFVSDIYPLLQIYAGSFFAIPLVRWLFLRTTNFEIERRNRAREQRARALESPDLSLRRKLLSARDMAQRTYIGQDRIVYSTESDSLEQDYEAQEWDQRFREIEKSD